MSKSFRIVNVRARPLSLALREPFVIASATMTETRSVEVTIEIENGNGISRGMGEGAALPPVTEEDQPDVLSAVARFQSAVVGREWRFDRDALAPGIDEFLQSSPVARAGVETALVDAIARAQRMPFMRWLDEANADGMPLITDITIPILEPTLMTELALDWRKKGFRLFKVKVGKNIDADLQALEAIVGAIPDASFRIDANGGFNVADSIALAQSATRLGLSVECYEQLCDANDLDAMAKVAEAIAEPVIADEAVRSLSDFEQIVRHRAADGINLKLAKLGGPLKALALGRAAKAQKMPIMMGGMVESRLGMTAAAHVAAALGGVEFVDLDTAYLLALDPYRGGYANDGPTLVLSNAFGLGVARA